MKIAANSVVVVLISLLLSVPCAHAGPFAGRNAREGIHPGGGGGQQNTNPREIQRPFAQRNAGGEDRAQRMSPEERRQLRRDIREAGREIYRPRR